MGMFNFITGKRKLKPKPISISIPDVLVQENDISIVSKDLSFDTFKDNKVEIKKITEYDIETNKILDLFRKFYDDKYTLPFKLMLAHLSKERQALHSYDSKKETYNFKLNLGYGYYTKLKYSPKYQHIKFHSEEYHFNTTCLYWKFINYYHIDNINTMSKDIRKIIFSDEYYLDSLKKYETSMYQAYQNILYESLERGLKVLSDEDLKNSANNYISTPR